VETVRRRSGVGCRVARLWPGFREKMPVLGPPIPGETGDIDDARSGEREGPRGEPVASGKGPKRAIVDFTGGHFVGLEGMPSDWYLRLAGEGGRMLRGERLVRAAIPIRP
jgi:hypothetical protein